MGNYLVMLQNDCNAVIYDDALWDSKTYVPMKADNGHNGVRNSCGDSVNTNEAATLV
ncbi:hypothetical protein QJS10_CPA07g00495 [Acorus calamus]|uniref:Uncharacterized protein n=1 Tax=Acorus calamus TaxID=4465 RepID=A0AAV9EHN8_ACOCL|nr:hypothetical protein QJS10_CPA07g00495 [Acorus calamus]